jgi:hypothetical protein
MLTIFWRCGGGREVRSWDCGMRNAEFRTDFHRGCGGSPSSQESVWRVSVLECMQSSAAFYSKHNKVATGVANEPHPDYTIFNSSANGGSRFLHRHAMNRSATGGSAKGRKTMPE